MEVTEQGSKFVRLFLSNGQIEAKVHFSVQQLTCPKNK